MHKGKLLSIAATAAVLAALPMPGWAWEPQRPIEVTNPFAAGGDSDLSGRAAMESAKKFIDQPLVTVNRPGAGGSIGYQFMVGAGPDGHSIIWTSGSLLTLVNLGNLPFPYDKLRHVCRMGIMPTVIAVRSDAPWKDMRELVADAKQAPGKIKLGDSGAGSFTFVAAKLLEQIADVKFTSIPVGADRRVATLLSGEVDASIVHPGEVISIYQGGDFRFLAISTDTRHRQFPDVPTFKEQGLDIGVNNFRGIAAPPGTPDEIVNRLAEVFEQASKGSEWLTVAEERLAYESSYLAGEAYSEFLANQNALIRRVLEQVELAK